MAKVSVAAAHNNDVARAAKVSDWLYFVRHEAALIKLWVCSASSAGDSEEHNGVAAVPPGNQLTNSASTTS